MLAIWKRNSIEKELLSLNSRKEQILFLNQVPADYWADSKRFLTQYNGPVSFSEDHTIKTAHENAKDERHKDIFAGNSFQEQKVQNAHKRPIII
jgi:hypothetical protein